MSPTVHQMGPKIVSKSIYMAKGGPPGPSRVPGCKKQRIRSLPERQNNPFSRKQARPGGPLGAHWFPQNIKKTQSCE